VAGLELEAFFLAATDAQNDSNEESRAHYNLKADRIYIRKQPLFMQKQATSEPWRMG
jgi:hypothetical protein